jgi:teichuronic acid biosynthesis glycosyltransferase TuaH
MIVLWGNSAWDGHRLGAQHLAAALAERVPVLYVDPPLSLAVAARAGRRALWTTLSGPRLSMPIPGLARLTPLAPPGKTRAGMRIVTQQIARRSVHRAVRELGGSVRAVVSGYLYAHPFGFCGERWRVFRASDDFSVGAELGIPVGYMARAQDRLAASSDAVVCVSPTLAERFRGQGYDPVLIPNGCDAARLADAGSLDRPADIRLSQPIVGYIGQLASRIDFDLLREVAGRGHSLLLIGAIRPDLDRSAVDDLLDRPNVQWLGHRSYDDLPAYLGAMAVGVVPYQPTAFNRASFPLKLLEYLGAGLPVVATDLPSVRWLDTDLVRVADDPVSFADEVERAIAASDDGHERERRLHLAAEHSWSSRAAAYLALLDDLDRRRAAVSG